MHLLWKRSSFAALGKMGSGLDGYVLEVERGEYKLLFKTNRVFEAVVRNCPKLLDIRMKSRLMILEGII